MLPCYPILGGPVHHRKPAARASRCRSRRDARRRGPLRAVALLAAAVVSPSCGRGEEAAPPPRADERIVREVVPPPGVGPRHFVNRKESLVVAAPELTAHFLPFSLDLPDGWTYEEGGSRPPRTNFVKIERRIDARTTAENFSVGVFWSSASIGPIEEEVLSTKIDKFKRTVERSLPGARILADASLTVDGRAARGFRFATQAPGETKDAPPLDGFGLVLFVPDLNGSDGAVVILMGTAADKRFGSADDVGVKGDGPRILASLKFGK